MSIHLDLPTIQDQTAFNLDRWEEVCADPIWTGFDGRIETDAYGQVIMNYPAEFSHGGKQSELVVLMCMHLPHGKVTVECPISTSEGIKVADVAWVSEKRLLKIAGRKALAGAPEICVEVLSPSNTRGEIEGKMDLYFEAGAKEVWLCEQTGKLRFFLKKNPNVDARASGLCPGMAGRVGG